MTSHATKPRRRAAAGLVRARIGLALACGSCALAAGALQLRAAPAQCGIATAAAPLPPAAAATALADSRAVPGQRDIRWAWLGSPTRRYPHGALGSPVHAGSLHVLVAGVSGGMQELQYQLPLQRVFEDRLPRLADLDGDGRDEIILVESDLLRGSAVVVFGVASGTAPAGAGAAGLRLVEIARSPPTGSSFRWLNPIGVADFDGDGRPDIASVSTPHVGGVLTLYRFAAPQLVPFATRMDVSNHRMGEVEQQLALVLEQPGERPVILVGDMQLRALQALRWDASGQWQELAEPLALPARIEQLTPVPGGGCLRLADGSWWRVLQP